MEITWRVISREGEGGQRGEKTGTTVIAQSVKYTLKNSKDKKYKTLKKELIKSLCKNNVKGQNRIVSAEFCACLLGSPFEYASDVV